MQDSYIWGCGICGAVIERKPGESFDEFNERIFDTHTVYHLAFDTGLSPELLRACPELAIGVKLNTRFQPGSYHPERN